MSIIDFILNLFRDPVEAASYVADPQAALANAGLSAVSAAQVGAVMPVVAESVASNYGYQSQWVNTGNPIHDLSGNLQNYYAAQPDGPSILSPSLLSPRDNDFLSHNDTDFASHNPIASGNQVMSPSGNVDSFNRGPLLDLSFGDLQFGNRDTTAIGDGAVAVGGSNSGPIASGQGSTAVNGDVRDSNIINADHGSNVGVDQSQTRVGGDYTNVSGHGSADIDKSVTVVDDHSQRNTTNINDSFNTDRSTNIGSGNTTNTEIGSHNQANIGTSTSAGGSAAVGGNAGLAG
ncbi:IniB N-terminal domain-containing protein, partial [Mycobacteroides abscessus]